jgi:membrane protein DedA with SNARE-associated domain
LEHLAHFFLSIVDRAGYPGLFAVMVIGNLGLPVGTEFVVPAAGALSATGHLPSVWLTGVVATFGEIVGGGLLYAIGYVGGRPFVVRYGRFIKVDEKKLDEFGAFYERYGNVVVLICRFLPFVRGFSALPAGVSRMPKRYFFAYTAVGSAVFCFGLVYLGSTFGQHFNEIAPQIHKVTTAFIVALLLAVALFVAARIVWARRKASQAP